MSFVKYRLKEVATDFGTTPKEIADIIAKYGERPKSNTQVLTDEELNVVFDHMTKNRQVADLQQAVASAAPTKKPEHKPEGNRAPRQGENRERRDFNRDNNREFNREGRRDNRDNRPQQNNRPAQQPAAQPAVKQPEPERKRERRVVDTSAVQVNSNRFADVDNLVDQRVQDYQGGKQRIGGGKGKQQKQQQKGNFKGNKSKKLRQRKDEAKAHERNMRLGKKK